MASYTGLTYLVYSIAVHTRFKHYLGVYWLASESVQSLKKYQDLNCLRRFEPLHLSKTIPLLHMGPKLESSSVSNSFGTADLHSVRQHKSRKVSFTELQRSYKEAGTEGGKAQLHFEEILKSNIAIYVNAQRGEDARSVLMQESVALAILSKPGQRINA